MSCRLQNDVDFIRRPRNWIASAGDVPKCELTDELTKWSLYNTNDYKKCILANFPDLSTSPEIGGGAVAPGEPAGPDEPTPPEEPDDPDEPTEPEAPDQLLISDLDLFSDWPRDQVVEVEQGDEWTYTIETPYDRSIKVEAILLYGRNFISQEDEANRHHVIAAPKVPDEGVYQLCVIVGNAVS